MGHKEKPSHCECCDFETSELDEFDAYTRTMGHGPFTPEEDKEWAWLCSACTSTHASSTYLYPRQERSNNDVLKAMSYYTNMILAALKAAQPKEEPDAKTD